MRRLVAVLTLVAAYRVSLLGRGAMAFIDETLYYKAPLALQALASGHVRAAVFHIVTNNARPGDAVLMLLPASLQGALSSRGIGVSSPASLLVPTAFNVAVSLIAALLVYRLCRLFTDHDEPAALTVTVAYALLANSNVYVRHLVPYDWALALWLYALWLIAARPVTARTAVAAGLLAGAVVLVYPGYYPLAAVIAAAAAGTAASPWRVRASRAGCVIAAAAVPIVATQLAARWAGFDYLGSARQLSGTIVGGSFDEGASFLWRYLIEVEGAAGVVLICGLAAYVAAGVADLRRRRGVAVIHWVVAAATAAWIWQAAAATLARSMVLYGRLIHPWMAVLTFALAFALHALPSRRLRTTACALILVMSTASWAIAASRYYRLAYPRDVLYALAIDTALVPQDRRFCEFEPTQTYDSPRPAVRGPMRASAALTLINMCQGYPVPDRVAPRPDAATVVFDGPHFTRYPAYAFEGYTPDQRRQLHDRDYRVRVYEAQR